MLERNLYTTKRHSATCGDTFSTANSNGWTGYAINGDVVTTGILGFHRWLWCSTSCTDHVFDVTFPFAEELHQAKLIPTNEAEIDTLCCPGEQLKNLQKILTRQVEDLLLHNTLPRLSVTLVERLKTYNIRGSLGNRWLQVLPVSGSLRIPISSFERAMRMRYNLKLINTAVHHTCICGVALNDLHPFSCKRNNGASVTRHNKLNLVLSSACSRAGLIRYMEQGIVHENRTKRKPDLVIDQLVHEFARSWVDVSVTHPELPSYARLQISAVEQRVQMKKRQYAPLLVDHNANFYPAVVDVFGKMSKQFCDLVSTISSHAAENREYDAAIFKNFVMGELSVALQIGNAFMISNCTRTAVSPMDRTAHFVS